MRKREATGTAAAAACVLLLALGCATTPGGSLVEVSAPAGPASLVCAERELRELGYETSIVAPSKGVGVAMGARADRGRRIELGLAGGTLGTMVPSAGEDLRTADVRAIVSACSESPEARIARIRSAWPEDVAAQVLAGEVAIGMTPEMVVEAWGPPRHVNTTVSAGGRQEQWVYGTDGFVYVEGGRVTAIQVSR